MDNEVRTQINESLLKIKGLQPSSAYFLLKKKQGSGWHTVDKIPATSSNDIEEKIWACEDTWGGNGDYRLTLYDNKDRRIEDFPTIRFTIGPSNSKKETQQQSDLTADTLAELSNDTIKRIKVLQNQRLLEGLLKGIDKESDEMKNVEEKLKKEIENLKEESREEKLMRFLSEQQKMLNEKLESINKGQSSSSELPLIMMQMQQMQQNFMRELESSKKDTKEKDDLTPFMLLMQMQQQNQERLLSELNKPKQEDTTTLMMLLSQMQQQNQQALERLKESKKDDSTQLMMLMNFMNQQQQFMSELAKKESKSDLSSVISQIQNQQREFLEKIKDTTGSEKDLTTLMMFMNQQQQLMSQIAKEKKDDISPILMLINQMNQQQQQLFTQLTKDKKDDMSPVIMLINQMMQQQQNLLSQLTKNKDDMSPLMMLVNQMLQQQQQSFAELYKTKNNENSNIFNVLIELERLRRESGESKKSNSLGEILNSPAVQELIRNLTDKKENAIEKALPSLLTMLTSTMTDMQNKVTEQIIESAKVSNPSLPDEWTRKMQTIQHLTQSVAPHLASLLGKVVEIVAVSKGDKKVVEKILRETAKPQTVEAKIVCKEDQEIAEVDRLFEQYLACLLYTSDAADE